MGAILTLVTNDFCVSEAKAELWGEAAVHLSSAVTTFS